MCYIVDKCPHLAALVGPEALQRLLTAEARWWHPLKIISSWRGEVRDQYLAGLDRAVEVMGVVLRRSPDRVRAQMTASLLKRESYESVRAEITCGARLELLGHQPVMEGEVGPQPDFRCQVAGQTYYVEVYTPFAAPTETIVDDVRQYLRDVKADCFLFLKTSGLPRESKTAKQIAGALRRGIADMLAADALGAVFAVPAGGDMVGWQAKIGGHQFEFAGGEPRLFARVTVDGASGFRVAGGADLQVADPVGAAKKALQDFGQLRKGNPNVLVVDLTSIRPNRFDVEAYEQVAQKVCARHPELAAVLLTWRDIRLQPSPSTEFEIVSGYRLVQSERGDAAQFPVGVADALVQPGLIYPGRDNRHPGAGSTP
jgi:hypothetical protein